ncbi:MAG: YggT family protein [Spirochaetaceae bacterium]|jgi:YggT family protein|nr:YggT family protein [Spirochaetaceae bacterium]
MGDMIRSLLSVFSGLLMLYSMLIFIRIVLTLFSSVHSGKLFIYVCRITDPYLFWFSRFKIFHVGNMDLSPIVAIVVLTIVNNVIGKIAETGTITIGFFLALLLSAVWQAVSYIFIFFILLVVLRLLAYLLSANIYSSFWRLIDFASRPLIYTINRILFRNRIVNYFFGLLSATLTLVLLYAIVYILVNRIAVPLLVLLPI